MNRVLGLVLLSLLAQAQKLSFEVASIRPNTSGSESSGLGPRGDRLVATNVTLENLLLYAYGPGRTLLKRAQVVGGPSWTETDRFDIQAKLEGNAVALPVERTKEMVQALLEDRFQLKIHREMRDLPGYNLVVTKGGPKPSADQTPPPIRNQSITFAAGEEPVETLPRGAMRVTKGPSGTIIRGAAIPISLLLPFLQGQTDRIIVDQTGFRGFLDVHMEFSTDGTGTSPSLFTAIQEIGLKLESAKTPTDVWVIDSVQKPSEN